MSLGFVIMIIGVMILMAIGVVGIFAPVIPGLPLIWLGIIIYAIFTGFDDVTWVIIGITGFLTVIGVVIDFVSGIFGAKVYGASWYGVCGAIIGGVIGLLLFNVLGLIIGTMCGVFVVEYLRHQKMQRAIHASVGTLVGFVGNIVIQFFLATLMIGIFISSILLF